MKEIFFSGEARRSAALISAIAFSGFVCGLIASRCCFDAKRDRLRPLKEIVEFNLALGMLVSVPALIANKPFNAAAWLDFWFSVQLGFVVGAYLNKHKISQVADNANKNNTAEPDKRLSFV